MTDIRNSGVARETLLATTGVVRHSGLSRETLLAATGVARHSGIYRETLRSAASGASYIKAAAMYREVLLGTAVAVAHGRRRGMFVT